LTPWWWDVSLLPDTACGPRYVCGCIYARQGRALGVVEGGVKTLSRAPRYRTTTCPQILNHLHPLPGPSDLYFLMTHLVPLPAHLTDASSEIHRATSPAPDSESGMGLRTEIRPYDGFFTKWDGKISGYSPNPSILWFFPSNGGDCQNLSPIPALNPGEHLLGMSNSSMMACKCRPETARILPFLGFSRQMDEIVKK